MFTLPLTPLLCLSKMLRIKGCVSGLFVSEVTQWPVIESGALLGLSVLVTVLYNDKLSWREREDHGLEPELHHTRGKSGLGEPRGASQGSSLTASPVKSKPLFLLHCICS